MTNSDLKTRPKSKRHSSKSCTYEALRRERFNAEIEKLRLELSTEIKANTKVEVVMAARLFVKRCKTLHTSNNNNDSPTTTVLATESLEGGFSGFKQNIKSKSDPMDQENSHHRPGCPRFTQPFLRKKKVPHQITLVKPDDHKNNNFMEDQTLKGNCVKNATKISCQQNDNPNSSDQLDDLTDLTLHNMAELERGTNSCAMPYLIPQRELLKEVDSRNRTNEMNDTEQTSICTMLVDQQNTLNHSAATLISSAAISQVRNKSASSILTKTKTKLIERSPNLVNFQNLDGSEEMHSHLVSESYLPHIILTQATILPQTTTLSDTINCTSIITTTITTTTVTTNTTTLSNPKSMNSSLPITKPSRTVQSILSVSPEKPYSKAKVVYLSVPPASSLLPLAIGSNNCVSQPGLNSVVFTATSCGSLLGTAHSTSNCSVPPSSSISCSMAAPVDVSTINYQKLSGTFNSKVLPQIISKQSQNFNCNGQVGQGKAHAKIQPKNILDKRKKIFNHGILKNNLSGQQSVLPQLQFAGFPAQTPLVIFCPQLKRSPTKLRAIAPKECPCRCEPTAQQSKVALPIERRNRRSIGLSISSKRKLTNTAGEFPCKRLKVPSSSGTETVFPAITGSLTLTTSVAHVSIPASTSTASMMNAAVVMSTSDSQILSTDVEMPPLPDLEQTPSLYIETFDVDHCPLKDLSDNLQGDSDLLIDEANNKYSNDLHELQAISQGRSSPGFTNYTETVLLPDHSDQAKTTPISDLSENQSSSAQSTISTIENRFSKSTQDILHSFSGTLNSISFSSPSIALSEEVHSTDVLATRKLCQSQELDSSHSQSDIYESSMAQVQILNSTQSMPVIKRALVSDDSVADVSTKICRDVSQSDACQPTVPTRSVTELSVTNYDVTTTKICLSSDQENKLDATCSPRYLHLLSANSDVRDLGENSTNIIENDQRKTFPLRDDQSDGDGLTSDSTSTSIAGVTLAPSTKLDKISNNFLSTVNKTMAVALQMTPSESMSIHRSVEHLCSSIPGIVEDPRSITPVENQYSSVLPTACCDEVLQTGPKIKLISNASEGIHDSDSFFTGTNQILQQSLSTNTSSGSVSVPSTTASPSCSTVTINNLTVSAAKSKDIGSDALTVSSDSSRNNHGSISVDAHMNLKANRDLCVGNTTKRNNSILLIDSNVDETDTSSKAARTGKEIVACRSIVDDGCPTTAIVCTSDWPMVTVATTIACSTAHASTMPVTAEVAPKAKVTQTVIQHLPFVSSSNTKIIPMTTVPHTIVNSPEVSESITSSLPSTTLSSISHSYARSLNTSTITSASNVVLRNKVNDLPSKDVAISAERKTLFKGSCSALNPKSSKRVVNSASSTTNSISNTNHSYSITSLCMSSKESEPADTRTVQYPHYDSIVTSTNSGGVSSMVSSLLHTTASSPVTSRPIAPLGSTAHTAITINADTHIATPISVPCSISPLSAATQGATLFNPVHSVATQNPIRKEGTLNCAMHSAKSISSVSQRAAMLASTTCAVTPAAMSFSSVLPCTTYPSTRSDGTHAVRSISDAPHYKIPSTTTKLNEAHVSTLATASSTICGQHSSVVPSHVILSQTEHINTVIGSDPQTITAAHCATSMTNDPKVLPMVPNTSFMSSSCFSSISNFVGSAKAAAGDNSFIRIPCTTASTTGSVKSLNITDSNATTHSSATLISDNSPYTTAYTTMTQSCTAPSVTSTTMAQGSTAHTTVYTSTTPSCTAPSTTYTSVTPGNTALTTIYTSMTQGSNDPSTTYTTLPYGSTVPSTTYSSILHGSTYPSTTYTNIPYGSTVPSNTYITIPHSSNTSVTTFTNIPRSKGAPSTTYTNIPHSSTTYTTMAHCNTAPSPVTAAAHMSCLHSSGDQSQSSNAGHASVSYTSGMYSRVPYASSPNMTTQTPSTGMVVSAAINGTPINKTPCNSVSYNMIGRYSVAPYPNIINNTHTAVMSSAVPISSLVTSSGQNSSVLRNSSPEAHTVTYHSAPALNMGVPGISTLCTSMPTPTLAEPNAEPLPATVNNISCTPQLRVTETSNVKVAPTTSCHAMNSAPLTTGSRTLTLDTTGSSNPNGNLILTTSASSSNIHSVATALHLKRDVLCRKETNLTPIFSTSAVTATAVSFVTSTTTSATERSSSAPDLPGTNGLTSETQSPSLLVQPSSEALTGRTNAYVAAEPVQSRVINLSTVSKENCSLNSESSVSSLPSQASSSSASISEDRIQCSNSSVKPCPSTPKMFSVGRPESSSVTNLALASLVPLSFAMKSSHSETCQPAPERSISSAVETLTVSVALTASVSRNLFPIQTISSLPSALSVTSSSKTVLSSDVKSVVSHPIMSASQQLGISSSKPLPSSQVTAASFKSPAFAQSTNLSPTVPPAPVTSSSSTPLFLGGILPVSSSLAITPTLSTALSTSSPLMASQVAQSTGSLQPTQTSSFTNSTTLCKAQTQLSSLYPPSMTNSGMLKESHSHDANLPMIPSSSSMYSSLMLNSQNSFSFLNPNSSNLGCNLRANLCAASSSLLSSNSSIYCLSSTHNYTPTYATFASLPLSNSSPTSFSFSLSSEPSSAAYTCSSATSASLSNTSMTTQPSNMFLPDKKKFILPNLMPTIPAGTSHDVYKYPGPPAWDNPPLPAGMAPLESYPPVGVMYGGLPSAGLDLPAVHSTATPTSSCFYTHANPTYSSATNFLRTSNVSASSGVTNHHVSRLQCSAPSGRTDSISQLPINTTYTNSSTILTPKNTSASNESGNDSSSTTTTVSSGVPAAYPCTPHTNLSSAGFFVPTATAQSSGYTKSRYSASLRPSVSEEQCLSVSSEASTAYGSNSSIDEQTNKSTNNPESSSTFVVSSVPKIHGKTVSSPSTSCPSSTSSPIVTHPLPTSSVKVNDGSSKSLEGHPANVQTCSESISSKLSDSISKENVSTYSASNVAISSSTQFTQPRDNTCLPFSQSGASSQILTGNHSTQSSCVSASQLSVPKLVASAAPTSGFSDVATNDIVKGFTDQGSTVNTSTVNSCTSEPSSSSYGTSFYGTSTASIHIGNSRISSTASSLADGGTDGKFYPISSTQSFGTSKGNSTSFVESCLGNTSELRSKNKSNSTVSKATELPSFVFGEDHLKPQSSSKYITAGREGLVDTPGSSAYLQLTEYLAKNSEDGLAKQFGGYQQVGSQIATLPKPSDYSSLTGSLAGISSSLSYDNTADALKSSSSACTYGGNVNNSLQLSHDSEKYPSSLSNSEKASIPVILESQKTASQSASSMSSTSMMQPPTRPPLVDSSSTDMRLPSCIGIVDLHGVQASDSMPLETSAKSGPICLDSDAMAQILDSAASGDNQCHQQYLSGADGGSNSNNLHDYTNRHDGSGMLLMPQVSQHLQLDQQQHQHSLMLSQQSQHKQQQPVLQHMPQKQVTHMPHKPQQQQSNSSHTAQMLQQQHQQQHLSQNMLQKQQTQLLPNMQHQQQDKQSKQNQQQKHHQQQQKQQEQEQHLPQHNAGAGVSHVPLHPHLQQQHMISSHYGSVGQGFDYSGSICNTNSNLSSSRRNPVSPRGEPRQCYSSSSYTKQQLQHQQQQQQYHHMEEATGGGGINDLASVSNFLLDDGPEEREQLTDHVRCFSVSHLVSHSSPRSNKQGGVKSDEKRVDKMAAVSASKQVASGGKRAEAKARGKSGQVSADNRRRSPGRSTNPQHAAIWNTNKHALVQQKQPQNYSTEALLSTQNYMRAAPPQPINQNYPLMAPQNVYQYPHQMKNFAQNTAGPFGYASTSNNSASDACAPDYNFPLHQTAGSLGYASNMPYMAHAYPYHHHHHQSSSSTGMLTSDIMAASHPPPPYPRFHDFPSDQNSFAPNPSFPFTFEPQDMCGGGGGTNSTSAGVVNGQYAAPMLDNSSLIGGGQRGSACVPFSPLRMMGSQQGGNMAPAAAHLSSSLSNFNLTSIIPEIDNNKVGGDNSSLTLGSPSIRPLTNQSRLPSSLPPPAADIAPPPSLKLAAPQLEHNTNRSHLHHQITNSMNNFFPTHPQVGFGLNSSTLPPLPTSSFSTLNFPPADH